ncbi:hypothetical protein PUR59_17295 [Streptomyces sp. SP18ES09]|uniref:hypothetical protein n=1 Tax=Streptomyces sp. SP18ES09 TaxID=3002532 RepID=UPI002E789F87|nr:hypothetical protein [Streptomyces sp. SP18ES09]MEE1816765.1 hypothetical protein [Streptomyces sp. SP18ES09]
MRALGAVGLTGLLADPPAYEPFDPDAAGARSTAFEHLDRLALEHLLGVRRTVCRARP